jgi:lysine-specific demethylase 8
MVQTSSNIETIEKVSARTLGTTEFVSRYLLRQRPVVIKDLLHGLPIDAIRNVGTARKCLGETRLGFQREYFSRFLEARAFQYQLALEIDTLANYLEFVQQCSATDVVCSQFPLPANLAKLLEVPTYCGYNHEGEAISSFVFLAARGNTAHLHYDSDYNHALLYQLFGKKRVVLIPPEFSHRLNPFFNFSLLLLENISAEQQRSQLSSLGALEVVLEPGEAIFIPAAMWHFVEYVDTAMSISFRFGRNKYTKFIAGQFHSDLYVQNVAAKMIDADAVQERYLKHFSQIRRAGSKTYRNALAKFAYVESLFQEICEEISPESVKKLWWTPPEELIEKQRRIFIANGLYREP